jgi:copper chaperone CopZ
MLVASLNLKAQFISSTLKVDGLTCSMCSRTVHKALSSLSFIDSITPDLATTSFKLHFKKNQKVLLEEIKNKVEGAGFSIGELKVVFNFDKINVNNPLMFKYEDYYYEFVDGSQSKLTGNSSFKIIDKGYISKKEYKTNSKNPKYKCVYTPNAGDCKAGAETVDHIIHVTS